MASGSMRFDLAFVLARPWLQRPAVASAWTSLVALTVLSLAPLDPSVRTSAGGVVEHLIAYGLAAGAFVAAYGLSVGRIPVPLLLVALAGALELLQNIAPGRHPHFREFAAGSAGAVGGVLIAWLSLVLLNSCLTGTRARTN